MLVINVYVSVSVQCVLHPHAAPSSPDLVMCINILDPLGNFVSKKLVEIIYALIDGIDLKKLFVVIGDGNDDNGRPIKKCPDVHGLKSDEAEDIGINVREFSIATI
ncbi:hypothetical protein EVAR_22087_1 [Eumeta japonica]|uniref:Uncharacterized protein n=1 Tax=Eumeta variegata TaxID=151549 RepID=A0A4C1USQ7_EUMVA|nr:hypothetical protein EVAR_22087_1 [Eumeta japonica]